MSATANQAIFRGLTCEGLAGLLGVSWKQLSFVVYAKKKDTLYHGFTIQKRRGGERSISAPCKELKFIQRRLADLLQDNFSIRSVAHGFVRGRSILSNAESHARKRFVLNVDLRDFFPTVNFGRVRGLFLARPFSAPGDVATLLAQICIRDNFLPQGAPTSPVVSNLICSRLDRQLLGLAKEHRCTYSRYADDLTFSLRRGAFPPELARFDDSGNTVLGKPLRELVEGNGFQIHPDKVHLFRSFDRQIVTGLTVNEKPNVSRRFVREIRAMIADWRVNGMAVAEARHHSMHYRHPDRQGGMPAISRIVEGKINFLKMIRGADDGVRRNLQRQLVDVWPEYIETMEKENRELKMRDLFISHASEDKKDFVRPLVKALIKEGVSVWYDEHELTIGSDLAAEITKGLVHSRYGVVVMSPNFFKLKKTWPDREVGALTAQEDAGGGSRILPIWHDVDHAYVASKNPILARLLAWKSPDETPEALAVKLRDFLKTRRTK